MFEKVRKKIHPKSVAMQTQANEKNVETGIEAFCLNVQRLVQETTKFIHNRLQDLQGKVNLQTNV
ncbi:hypothetical protein BBR01nite_35880 [Brevibacillus brevis]|nr:hypothetical protein BBR01nite_35880 [Brevibacillus brevis]